MVQGLGHASFVLKHEKYKELRDDPESDWAFDPLNPKTYEVQFDLYLDAMEATPHGKYLHIGGDEVHTTGRGSDISPLELQLDWLNKVCEFAEEHCCAKKCKMQMLHTPPPQRYHLQEG